MTGIKTFLATIAVRIRQDNILSLLARGSTGSAALNVASYALLFIISILLARLLGAAGYGTYIYAISWSMVLGIPAALGLGRLAIRNVAAYHTRSDWSKIRGLLTWSTRITLLSSGLTMIIAAWCAYSLLTHENNETLRAFLMALLLLPIMALTQLKQSALQGLHHIVTGQFPVMIFQPLVIIVFITIAFFYPQLQLSATSAVGINVTAAGLTLLLSIYLFNHIIPGIYRNSEASYEKSIWIRSAASMLVISGLHIINSRTDVIMIGMLLNDNAVGIYNVAARGSELILFFLAPISAALGPVITRLYTEEDMERLQNIITLSSRILFLLSLPIALVLIIFGPLYLSLFGNDFASGDTTLSILCTGQLFNIAVGPVSLLLIMSRHEREAAISLGTGAALNIILNSVLIPVWGIEGAALATICSKTLWAIMMGFWAYKRIGVIPSIVGKFRTI